MQLNKSLSSKIYLGLVLAFLVLVFNQYVAKAKVIIQTDPKEQGLVNTIDRASISAYNQNRAVIRETRQFSLEKGINRLNWLDISPAIDIHSVNLSDAQDSKTIEIKEESYEQNFLGSSGLSALLTPLIGKTIHLRRFLPDGRSEEQSGILSQCDSANNWIIKIGERYVVNPKGQIELDELPSELITKSKLSFVIKAKDSGKKNLFLSYETGNVNWQCDYLVVLNNDQDRFNLTGWATIENQCGLNFRNSNLKLIAGDVQLNGSRPSPIMFRAQMASLNAENNTEISEQAFADYHLYTFAEPIDINNNETKRLSLTQRYAVPVEKKYIFEQQYYGNIPVKQKNPVQIKLEFKNDQTEKKPLPAGPVKVYQKDADGELQLIGGDRISHTPFGEKISIKIGEAFDIVGERMKLNSEQTSAHYRKETYKVSFDNHSDKDIIVTDIEHVPDLAEFKPDLAFTKMNSNTYQCEIKVPASGTANFNYVIECKI